MGSELAQLISASLRWLKQSESAQIQCGRDDLRLKLQKVWPTGGIFGDYYGVRFLRSGEVQR